MFQWLFGDRNAVKCGNCRSTGECSRCKGRGRIDDEQGTVTVVGATCTRCGGNGLCIPCSGAGWIKIRDLKPCGDRK